MTCRRETVDAVAYDFCPVAPPRFAGRTRAVLQARVMDEITEEPVSVSLALSSRSAGLRPRGAADGRVGLVGQPQWVMPGLDVAPVDLDLRIEAPGYLPLEIGGSLGPIPGFPDQFAPLDLLDVSLHRVAVALRGRTVQRAPLGSAVVANATVDLIGYWPTFPPPSVSPAAVMVPPRMVFLSPGLYVPRAAGATTLRRRDLNPVAGQDKTLLRPAAPGETRLRLSDRVGVAAGVPLIVDDGDPGRREHITVQQVDASSAPDQAAWVDLDHALAHTHLDGALCRVAAAQPPGPANPLDRDAIPADETAFLASMNGLPSGVVVELDDGAAPPEYHEMELYQTTSDADGHFRLPPIARVAMVLLHAERLGLAPPDDARLTPDYRLADNRITVTFP